MRKICSRPRTGTRAKATCAACCAFPRGISPRGFPLAVKEYQKEVAGRLRWLQYFRLGILGAIYLLLALDGLLVFRPLLRRVRSDAVEMSGLRRELEDSASRDPLTHLLNRRMLASWSRASWPFPCGTTLRFPRCCSKCRGLTRSSGSGARPQGTTCLKKSPGCCCHNVRISDYVFRYAADRFAVLAPSTDRAGATALADKLACLIQDYRFHDAVRVSARVGVRMMALDDDAQTLPARLEETLAEAKTCGEFLPERTPGGQGG